MLKPFMLFIGSICLLLAYVPTVSAQPKDENASFVIKNAVLKIVEQRDIPARISGVIQSNQIQEGTVVNVDQLVMQIDDRQTKVQLQKAEKELEMAQRESESRVDVEYAARSIQVAEAELGRALRSNQRRPGVVAQSEIDQLSLVVKKTIAEKQKIEFQMQMRAMSRDVSKLERDLEKLNGDLHQIKSPMRGKIVEVYRRQGEWVNVSEAVARVVRLDKLRAEVKVPAVKALNQLTGATATFYPKHQTSKTEAYPGFVVFVYPEANPISSEVRVWVEIDNEKLELIPGMTGRLEIEFAEENSEVDPLPLSSGTQASK